MKNKLFIAFAIVGLISCGGGNDVAGGHRSGGAIPPDLPPKTLSINPEISSRYSVGYVYRIEEPFLVYSTFDVDTVLELDSSLIGDSVALVLESEEKSLTAISFLRVAEAQNDVHFTERVIYDYKEKIVLADSILDIQVSRRLP